MGQAGADDDDRQSRLRELVARGAQRGHVVGPEVLHLVDEDRDPATGVRGIPTDIGEQLDEVDLDVAGVRASGHRGCGDAWVPPVPHLVRCRILLGEGLHHAEDVLVATAGLTELAHGLVQGRGQGPAQRLLRARLELAGAPAGPHRGRAQRVEQDGLADSAQAGEHDRALGPTPGHPLEDDVEGVELLVPAGELRGALAGARGVRVPDRVHAGRLSHDLRLSRTKAIHRDSPRSKPIVAYW